MAMSMGRQHLLQISELNFHTFRRYINTLKFQKVLIFILKIQKAPPFQNFKLINFNKQQHFANGDQQIHSTDIYWIPAVFQVLFWALVQIYTLVGEPRKKRQGKKYYIFSYKQQGGYQQEQWRSAITLSFTLGHTCVHFCAPWLQSPMFFPGNINIVNTLKSGKNLII